MIIAKIVSTCDVFAFLRFMKRDHVSQSTPIDHKDSSVSNFKPA